MVVGCSIVYTVAAVPVPLMYMVYQVCHQLSLSFIYLSFPPLLTRISDDAFAFKTPTVPTVPTVPYRCRYVSTVSIKDCKGDKKMVEDAVRSRSTIGLPPLTLSPTE